MSVSSPGEPGNGTYGGWGGHTSHCESITNSDDIIVPMDSIPAFGREHDCVHTYRMRWTPIDFERVTGLN